MLASRGTLLSLSNSLSLGTFIKHVQTTKLTTSKLKTLTRKHTTTSALLKTSHFETLSPCQKEQIHVFVDALLLWNQKMNLTAVREKSEVMERHIEDSLAIIPPIRSSYISYCGGSCKDISLVDVGSGAGLPGLVLAIACPDWQVKLLESMNKRCIFLEHAIELTGLSNVQVVRGRAEDLGQNIDFREAFDVAVARAVAEMRILAEYCLPLVRVGGLFVAAKGHDPQDEVQRALKAINLMGASLLQTLSGLHGDISLSNYWMLSLVRCRNDLKNYYRNGDKVCGCSLDIPILICIIRDLLIISLPGLRVLVSTISGDNLEDCGF